MKKTLISITVIILLSACEKEAQRKENTSNDNFQIELLFEKDGCKVYRFTDAGHSIYYTDCRGKIESVYDEHIGKTSHEVRIENETIK